MPAGISVWELLILLLVILLVFGPKRLPEIGRQLGKGMREFKDSISGKDDGRSVPPIGTQDTGGPVPPRDSSA
jgi:sec-independent protein translocase protein TatA